MTINVRRVVTGHDENGKAVVKIDDVAAHVSSDRANMTRQLIWTTNDLPVNFQYEQDGEDRGAREIPTAVKGGTVFRIIEYEPGVAPRNHRTDSIDYGVVLSGSIDMDLDGTVVRLRAGDVLVQRGTIHNWVNNGTEPCVVAFVLIDANTDQSVG